MVYTPPETEEDADAVDVATGPGLDRIGNAWGVTRRPNEPDEPYRERLTLEMTAMRDGRHPHAPPNRAMRSAEAHAYTDSVLAPVFAAAGVLPGSVANLITEIQRLRAFEADTAQALERELLGETGGHRVLDAKRTQFHYEDGTLRLRFITASTSDQAKQLVDGRAKYLLVVIEPQPVGDSPTEQPTLF